LAQHPQKSTVLRQKFLPQTLEQLVAKSGKYFRDDQVHQTETLVACPAG
jgi:hypothetical protein